MKRYDLETVHLAGQSPRGEMRESVDGEYVMFEDCSQHVDRMTKLIDILKETVENYRLAAGLEHPCRGKKGTGKMKITEDIRAAYLAGWKDCYDEPRPFTAARDNMCDRYLSSLANAPEAERTEPSSDEVTAERDRFADQAIHLMAQLDRLKRATKALCEAYAACNGEDDDAYVTARLLCMDGRTQWREKWT
ncbi:hypothetical protein [Rhizobium leguminosarum]